MRGYSTIELPDKIDTIKLDNLPEFDIEDYNLSDPKEVNRYFKSIERICRNSRAYKKFIDFLREQVDMNKCSFYENVNNIDTYSIKIHIHHAPLTLYDIVTTVYAKRLCNQEPLSELMVAKEVMWVHYNMMVGLIPLSETVHELVHKGLLFIPLNKVFGLYKNFINLYGSYMDPNLKSTIEEAERLNNLVNDILVLSRIESKTSKFYLEKINITSFIKSILERFEIYKNKGYVFIYNETKSHFIEADRQGLERVLYNLIINAINYTGKDKTITITFTEKKEYLRVNVTDTSELIKDTEEKRTGQE